MKERLLRVTAMLPEKEKEVEMKLTLRQSLREADISYQQYFAAKIKYDDFIEAIGNDAITFTSFVFSLIVICYQD